MSFRAVIFWSHLVAGLVAGSVIAVMSFTGAALAFETEIIGWAERGVRRVAPPPADAARRSVEALMQSVKAVAPEANISSIVVSADPSDAMVFSVGRDGAYYGNPYTGEIKSSPTTRTRDFMRVMVEWHRYLAMNGESRAIGKAITGACNAAFLVLGITGLYLWWPRIWAARMFRPSIWFVGAKGKARDWNWHNVFGFWSLPALIVLTASGLVISYRWAGNAVYRIVGEDPPVQQGRGTPGPVVTVPAPSSGARPLGFDGVLEATQKAVPNWETISLRLGGESRPGRGGPDRSAGDRGARPVRAVETGRGAAAVSVSVKEKNGWPGFVSRTLALNPYTGDVLKDEGYETYSAGRKARSWLRFLHTGQALGWPGQMIAAVACVGGLVLVYTGFALAARRFFGKRVRAIPREVVAASVSVK